jgi:uncharacterized membrane protein
MSQRDHQQHRRLLSGTIPFPAEPYGAATIAEFTRHDPLPRKRERVITIDLLRGLIMALMALDHCRMFLYKHNARGARGGDHEQWDNLPDYDDPWLFWTRFASHVCAPGFFFLMGQSLVLLHDARLNRVLDRWTSRDFMVYIAKRGLVLLIVSLTLSNMAIVSGFQLGGKTVYVLLLVIYALAVDYVLTAMVLLFVESRPTSEYSTRLAQPLLSDVVMEGIWQTWWREIFMIVLGLGVFVLTECIMPAPDFPSSQISVLAALTFTSGSTYGLISVYPFMPWLPMSLYGMAYGRLTRKWESARLLALNLVGLVGLFHVCVETGLGVFPWVPGGAVQPGIRQHPPADERHIPLGH